MVAWQLSVVIGLPFVGISGCGRRRALNNLFVAIFNLIAVHVCHCRNAKNFNNRELAERLKRVERRQSVNRQLRDSKELATKIESRLRR